MGSSSFLWDFQKLMKDWWRAKNVAESSANSGALYFPPRFLSPSFLGEELPKLEDFILLVYLFCFPPSTLLDNFLFSEFSPPEKKVSLFAVQIFICYYFFFLCWGCCWTDTFSGFAKNFSVFLICVFIWNFLPNQNCALLSSCVR